MTCSLCADYERWIKRLKDDRPLDYTETTELIEFLHDQQESHVNSTVEANDR